MVLAMLANLITSGCEEREAEKEALWRKRWREGKISMMSDFMPAFSESVRCVVE